MPRWHKALPTSPRKQDTVYAFYKVLRRGVPRHLCAGERAVAVLVDRVDQRVDVA
jgi:hypothetical protein